MKTCETCKAYSGMTKECRRKAPTAIPVQGPNGVQTMGVYPATGPSGWCLDHVDQESES